MSSALLEFQAWSFEEPDLKGESTWKVIDAPPENDGPLEESLEEARELVSDQLEEDEPAILPMAFERAEKFLRTQSHEMKVRLGFYPKPPTISPGPKGSADLHWERPDGGLLVNVPSCDPLATFYGEWGGTNRIKGSFDPKSWELGIFTWLSKN